MAPFSMILNELYSKFQDYVILLLNISETAKDTAIVAIEDE